MPKSRGRRPRHPNHARARQERNVRRRAAAVKRSGLMKNLAVVRAVDAAEARGDVVEAMELIEADLRTRREDELFWHPERLRGLMQLALFGGCLPSWAWSRWILAQAAR